MALLAAALLGSCSRSSPSGTAGGEEENRPEVARAKPLVAASAATRLLLSPDGHFAVAELGGQWRDDLFFDQWAEVPPVLKLIDLKTNEVVATANGWTLGAPKGKELLYVEEYGEEYRYRVRSTSRPDLHVDLAPPAGAWSVKAAVDFGPEAVAVVLWSCVPGFEYRDPVERREQLWIAVVDRQKMALRATAELVAATPYGAPRYRDHEAQRFGSGVVGDPVRQQLYVLEYPERGSAAWRVAAYDGSLKARWHARFAAPVRPPASAPTAKRTGRPRKAEPRRISEVPLDERADHLAAMTISGDGARLVVVRGREVYGAITFSATVHLIETTSGKVVNAAEIELPGQVRNLVPVNGKPQVGLLHLSAYREGLGESIAYAFKGVSVLDAASGNVSRVYLVTGDALDKDEYERMRHLRPGALAIDSSGLVLLSPQDYDWAEKHAGAKGLPGPDKEGLGRDPPEIRGLVTTPTDWHRNGRPRVEARDQFLRQCRDEN